MEIHNLDTGATVERPFVKVRAHPTKGLIWATAGAGNLFYKGRNCVTADLIGACFDQLHGDSLDLADLGAFLAPLVIERGRRIPPPADLHVLLGTAAAAFYLWFPWDPREGPPVVEQVHRKLIPSPDTGGFFGVSGPTSPGQESFPPRGSSPETVLGFMRPLLERAITFAQQNAGPDCDVAGPIDVALVGPAGARILGSSA
jgi:hypothetical protein